VVLKINKGLKTFDFKENLKTQKINTLVSISFFKKNKNVKENIKSQKKLYSKEQKHKFALN